MNDGQHQLPWEKPEVAMVISILGGKVVAVDTMNNIQVDAEVMDDAR